MSVAIHWFRRDLRITDNSALNAAAGAHDHVVPVYIVSPWKKSHHWCGAPRQEFLCGCLTALAQQLREKGGRLIIRSGSADAALEQLIRETEAQTITFNRDPDPFGRAMEAKVQAIAARLGVRVQAHHDHTVHAPEEILTGSGSSFRVFTPYAKAWSKRDKPAPGPALSRISVSPKIRSEALPTLATWGLKSDAKIVAPGEAAAQQRLEHFLGGPVFGYGQTRNFPAEAPTSRLSQDLRFGTLSIREIFAKCSAVAARSTASERREIGTFVNELIWREFYFQVLWFHPEVLEQEFQCDCRELPWEAHWRPKQRPPGAAFQRWCEGTTGFPIVDAGMRELNATGFMHNRLRMITAMFLTKDLHVWWMHGESWFMQRLVDGEIASNNGGWQWSASTGTDAAPYFRVQNPWTQSKRFDRDGAYIQRWVPELRGVPAGRLHQPPASLRLAKDYPLPMLDHAEERERAIGMFTGEMPRQRALFPAVAR